MLQFTNLDELMLPKDRELLTSPDRPLLGPCGTNPLTVVARVTEFCKRLDQGDDTTFARLQVAGEYLNEMGGWDLMQQCAQAVIKDRRDFADLLNHGWHGIGEWRA